MNLNAPIRCVNVATFTLSTDQPKAVIGRDAWDTSACWEAMLRSVRNFGLYRIAA